MEKVTPGRFRRKAWKMDRLCSWRLGYHKASRDKLSDLNYIPKVMFLMVRLSTVLYPTWCCAREGGILSAFLKGGDEKMTHGKLRLRRVTWLLPV